MSYSLANFGLPMPFRSRIRPRHATDRQTDRHRASFYNAPEGQGIMNNTVILSIFRENFIILAKSLTNKISFRVFLNSNTK